ncbi:hypothetical protein [Pseudosulfitobacter koreensis]|uniref:Uncharacterized protein n=1 Tax=Pseudosulfitobacter koreensis TaxID=2968472 RepID=A0ABT1Z422_9RHOB|nr:hypothetical protein [Pseudosulfitobacter koreense]MCR8827887.1 hypothetical protein [Pseudosulfitobacter koreense]
MYHGRIIPNGTDAFRSSEAGLRTFLASNADALGHAAVLLSGRRGARLINAIMDGLDQPGPLTRRLRQRLLELRDILFLEHLGNEAWEDDACLALLEPDDLAVSEICLLADGINDALLSAGLIVPADVLAG